MRSKEIVINNDKDLNKFYRRLKFYKLFFYKNTIFKSNNEEIKPIIRALNIKNRKDRITYIYDYACSYVDDYMKKQNKNPCGFKNCRCYTQHYKGCPYKNGCCRRCIFQSEKGCITSNLTCKLFYCSEVKKRYKTLSINDIKILKLFGLRQKEMIKSGYFISRESYINNLYIGSIILFTLKSILLIISLIIKKF